MASEEKVIPKHLYNWRPDSPDIRDYRFEKKHSKAVAALPTTVSLRDKMPPVFDQGQLGSCTANSLSGAMGFIHPGFIGSRLQIYYDERAIEGDIGTDGGAQIRDGVKSLNQTGVAPETMWPYEVAKFKTKPPVPVFTAAAEHKVSSYSRLDASGADLLDNMLQCLAQGFPFVYGFTVYASFESASVAKSGVVPMPKSTEQTVGGHAVVAIGYDNDFHNNPAFKKSKLKPTALNASMIETRNSWAEDWGDQGNFWIPQAYLTNSDLASDMWTLRA